MTQYVLCFSLLLLLLTGCNDVPVPDSETAPDTSPADKQAILDVLNQETAAAFNRRYDDWQAHWVHAPYVTKTYMNFADSSLTETLGWAEVDRFVVEYFADHPAPDPLPEPLTDIDVRVYGDGAWVSYEQDDPGRGRKRETRLMERHDGRWKIAGMQTVIYPN